MRESLASKPYSAPFLTVWVPPFVLTCSGANTFHPCKGTYVSTQKDVLSLRGAPSGYMLLSTKLVRWYICDYVPYSTVIVFRRTPLMIHDPTCAPYSQSVHFSSSRYSDEKLLAHRLQLVKCLQDQEMYVCTVHAC